MSWHIGTTTIKRNLSVMKDLNPCTCRQLVDLELYVRLMKACDSSPFKTERKPDNTLVQVLANFSVKGQEVNIPGFKGCTVSISTTQLFPVAWAECHQHWHLNGLAEF